MREIINEIVEIKEIKPVKKERVSNISTTTLDFNAFPAFRLEEASTQGKAPIDSNFEY
jgi:hypothetical protein